MPMAQGFRKASVFNQKSMNFGIIHIEVLSHSLLSQLHGQGAQEFVFRDPQLHSV